MGTRWVGEAVKGAGGGRGGERGAVRDKGSKGRVERDGSGPYHPRFHLVHNTTGLARCQLASHLDSSQLGASVGQVACQATTSPPSPSHSLTTPNSQRGPPPSFPHSVTPSPFHSRQLCSPQELFPPSQ